MIDFSIWHSIVRIEPPYCLQIYTHQKSFRKIFWAFSRPPSYQHSWPVSWICSHNLVKSSDSEQATQSIRLTFATFVIRPKVQRNQSPIYSTASALKKKNLIKWITSRICTQNIFNPKMQKILRRLHMTSAPIWDHQKNLESVKFGSTFWLLDSKIHSSVPSSLILVHHLKPTNSLDT